MDLVISMDRMPEVGETVQGREMHTVPGGKGANQAAGCARLGTDTVMIGAVGSDLFGKQLLDNMKKQGVQTEAIAVHDDTGTGIASIYHTREDNCIVIVPGANDRCTAEWVEKNRKLIEEADVMLTQLEIPLPAVERALTLAREAGVVTVLNPAPARPLPAELLAKVDYLTPNETEFALLAGTEAETEAELEAAMQSWQEKYGTRVIVTRGKDGCSFLNEEGRLATVPSLKVEVVDTTGAGDTLNAAFCCKLAAGSAIPEAVDYAVRAASLSVTKFGAQQGLPTPEEIERTYK
ncbi:ribokinase [Paenibacillus beijingensis]|uniref:Deoxyribokinase n=2 Tax=Paenibacillus beijingensis TaxID=1126833 RepID=A0A0D5NRW6_9BACL|nr:ribokinase [Paenibacillus beijingensis]